MCTVIKILFIYKILSWPNLENHTYVMDVYIISAYVRTAVNICKESKLRDILRKFVGKPTRGIHAGKNFD